MTHPQLYERLMADDPREAKLPVWAQDKMAAYRKATKEAVEELEALKTGTKKSCFYFQDWNEKSRFYLPPSRRCLVFQSGDNVLWLTAPEPGEGGWLAIYGHYTVIVRPCTSNVLKVRSGGRQ